MSCFAHYPAEGCRLNEVSEDGMGTSDYKVVEEGMSGRQFAGAMRFPRRKEEGCGAKAGGGFTH